MPSWLTFTNNANGTGTFTGTPPTGSAGSYIISIDAFNGTAPDAPQTLTITVSTVSATFGVSPASPTVLVGQADLVSATVTPGAGAATPTGTVTFSDGAGHSSTVALGATGAASASFTETVAAATRSPPATRATPTTQRPARTTVITVGIDATTGLAGHHDRCCWSRRPRERHRHGDEPPGTGVPTGTVTFSDGAGHSSTVGLDSSGSASYAFVETVAGSYTITASYSGDANYSASTATTAFTVGIDATTTGAFPASGTVVAGQGDLVSASVFPQAPGTGTPTGTVTFSDGAGQSYAVALSSGTASATFTETLGGNYTITASYSGDANYSASSTTTAIIVDQAPTITSANTAAASVAKAFSYTVTTTGFPAATIQATGMPSWLTFTNNANGTGTFTGTPPTGSAGSYIISIDAFNGTAPDAPQTLTITVSTVSATFGVSPASPTVLVGQADLVSATVTPGAGAATPTGTVTFSDGAGHSSTVALGATGAASASFTETVAGSYTITASYSGDANYSAASATTAITVGIDATTVAVSPATTTAVAGQGDLVSATVTANAPGTGVPTGTVTFSDGAGHSSTVGLDSSGSASYAFVETVAGSYTITASYSGDANYSASTATTAFTVGIDATTTGAFPASGTVVAGQGDLVSASVFPQAPGTGTPTGTVTFSDGAGQSYAVALSSGTASATFTETLGGNYTITASYSGDANYSASSTTTAIIVDQAPTITSANTAAASVAKAFSYTVTTTGFPAATIQATGMPSWLTFTNNANGTGTFTGTPPTGSAGSYIISIDAFNGTAPDAPQTLTITVSTVSATFGVSPASPTVLVGQADLVSATVTPGAGAATPTGTVTFSDGAGHSSTVALGATGAASASFTETVAGSYTITASYSGDANYSGQRDDRDHGGHRRNDRCGLAGHHDRCCWSRRPRERHRHGERARHGRADRHGDLL